MDHRRRAEETDHFIFATWFAGGVLQKSPKACFARGTYSVVDSELGKALAGTKGGGGRPGCAVLPASCACVWYYRVLLVEALWVCVDSIFGEQ